LAETILERLRVPAKAAKRISPARDGFAAARA
jgi:hypothetical protein